MRNQFFGTLACCALLLVGASEAQAQVLATYYSTYANRVGTSEPNTLFLGNATLSELVVTNVTVTGPDSAAFVTSFSGPIVVPSLSSNILPFVFTPTRAGRHTATLTITSNDVNTPITTVTLIAMGYNLITANDSGLAYISAGQAATEIDLATGNRRLLNPSNLLPAGPNVSTNGCLARGIGNSILIANDFHSIWLVAVDLGDLTRTFVSRSTTPFVGAGANFPNGIGDLRQGPDDRYYFLSRVSGQMTVGLIDIATGDRSTFSGTNPADSSAVGSGPTVGEYTSSMAFSADGDILLIENDTTCSLVTIDGVSGERSKTTLSPTTLQFRSIDALPDGNLVGVAFDNCLHTIEVPSGVTAKVSGLEAGELVGDGIPFRIPTAVTVAPNGQVYVAETEAGALLRVDLSSGDRAVVSGWGSETRGTGIGSPGGSTNSYSRTNALSFSNYVMPLSVGAWQHYK